MDDDTIDRTALETVARRARKATDSGGRWSQHVGRAALTRRFCHDVGQDFANQESAILISLQIKETHQLPKSIVVRSECVIQIVAFILREANATLTSERFDLKTT